MPIGAEDPISLAAEEPLRLWRLPGGSAGVPSVFDEATIAEAAPGSRVVLFGFHARGEAGPRSDLDFLAIEPEVENAAEESVRLGRALRGLGVAADVIVVSERDVADWRGVRGSLVHAALADGRVLAA